MRTIIYITQSMDKKPRVDKRKNVAKVAEVLAKNPNKTGREIAKEAGVPHRTTARAINELAQTGTKDETIAYIVGSSKARLRKGQAYLDRYLDESLNRNSLDDDKTKIITTILKDDLARITVLGGDVTNDAGGLVNVRDMSDDELTNYILNLSKLK